MKVRINSGMNRTQVNSVISLASQFDDQDQTKLLKHAKPFPRAFYERDVCDVARDLLGSILVRELNGHILAGFIVEAEAYRETEEACHAFRGKTPRNEVMFGRGGIAYIYFIYGMYWCLNATAEKEGSGSAVLIRAIEPFLGLETMRELRKRENITELCSGPGKLAVAMKLDRELNGWDLSKPPLRVLNLPKKYKVDFKMRRTKRIGINKACDLDYRFCVDGSPFLSKK